MALPEHDLERLYRLLVEGCGISRTIDDRLEFASRFRAQQAINQVGYDFVDPVTSGIKHPPQAERLARLGWTPVNPTAELAIWGYILQDPVRYAATGWLTSSAHRAVLDDPFWTHWGIGSYATFKPGDPTDDPVAARSYFIAWFSRGVPPVKAIVYSGAATVDALNASYLSGKYASPLFPVETNKVPTAISAEIAARQPQEILIVGGTGVVSSAVETELAKIAPVKRIAGATRYDTAIAVSRS